MNNIKIIGNQSHVSFVIVVAAMRQTGIQQNIEIWEVTADYHSYFLETKTSFMDKVTNRLDFMSLSSYVFILVTDMYS